MAQSMTIPKIIISVAPIRTTKASGVGTGLGLSVAHAIVSDHGGTVEVASPAGEGTTFTIDLPLYD